MRRIVLAALLSTVALPAWAYNDRPSAVADDWKQAAELCAKAGGDQPICHWHHHPDETFARNSALKFMELCNDPKTSGLPQCPGWRAYIKQRWGY